MKPSRVSEGSKGDKTSMDLSYPNTPTPEQAIREPAEDIIVTLREAAEILDRHPCEVVWLARDCREAAASIDSLRASEAALREEIATAIRRRDWLECEKRVNYDAAQRHAAERDAARDKALEDAAHAADIAFLNDPYTSASVVIRAMKGTAG